MKPNNDTESTETRNPPRVIVLTPEELEARIEAAVERGVERALAAARPEPAADIMLLDGRQLDRVLGISAATRCRLVLEGMPHEQVGTRRRFDVAACRAWLAARGSKPTKTMTTAPKTAAEDPIDVSRALGKAGLRRVGGAR